MIKTTVWTKWKDYEDYEDSRPKCIFIGEITYPPNVDDLIVVKDGFAATRITQVIHDFVTGELELRVDTSDTDNEYGPCLYKKELEKKSDE